MCISFQMKQSVDNEKTKIHLWRVLELRRPPRHFAHAKENLPRLI